MKLIKDFRELNGVVAEKTTIEDGEDTAKLLFKFLTDANLTHISAPMLGINKQVFVINVLKPYYFINPFIIEKSGEIHFDEIVIEKNRYKNVRTKRSSKILVYADNYEENLLWDVSHIKETSDYYKDLHLFETILIQHHISLLYGELPYKFESKRIPLKNNEKIGRNDKITLTKDNQIISVKYKVMDQYLKEGYTVNE